MDDITRQRRQTEEIDRLRGIIEVLRRREKLKDTVIDDQQTRISVLQRKLEELQANGQSFRETLHKLIVQLPSIVKAAATPTPAEVDKLRADLDTARTEIAKRDQSISDQTNELMELRQKLATTKQVYCLGRETVDKVIANGFLETKYVNFIAASDLANTELLPRDHHAKLENKVIELATKLAKLQLAAKLLIKSCRPNLSGLDTTGLPLNEQHALWSDLERAI